MGKKNQAIAWFEKSLAVMECEQQAWWFETHTKSPVVE